MANNLASYVATSIAIGSAVGSSTVGSVLFAGAGSLLAQNNANLFWDDTNGRLAIGTTTFSNAAVKLQVSSGADVRFVLADTVDGNASFWLRTNAVDRFVFNSNSSATDATTLTAVPFRLGTNNTVALTIDGSQNVGIGTQTPLAGTHLEVLGTSTAGRDVLIRGTGTDIGYSVNNTGTSGREYALISSNSGSVVGTGTFSIYDLTAGSTRLQISSTGAATIGPAVTGNSTGQRHVVSGALYAGNVTATDGSGELVISSNAKVGAGTAEDGRSNTTTGGFAITLNNRTADGSNGMIFAANLAGAATSTTATTVGSVTQAGTWTLGASSGTKIHTANGAWQVIAGADTANNGLYAQGFSNTPTTGAVFVAAILSGSGMFLSGSSTGVTAGNSTANAMLFVRKDTTTGRSINSAGTNNAAGADYAEYMTKARPSDVIAKAEVCGVDTNGLLTKKWSESVSFVLKSTDPAYVGGDAWFTRDRNDGESPSDYAAAQETARQAVDRVAFCGQAPCSVTGSFSSGDWIVAAVNSGDTIKAVVVADGAITFTQYKSAIGRVVKDLGGGKALLFVGTK